MPSSPLSLVREKYRKLLRLRPEELPAVDYCFCVCLSSQFGGISDPLWGWLIGPPGSGKGEILRPYDGYPTTLFVSSLTQSGLASGYETKDGDDPSLLKRLDGKLLVVKEFSAVLDSGADLFHKILGDLRDAYDGSYAKQSGTVGLRRYDSRFGFLAAVTTKIENAQEQIQELGERMLACRIGVSALSLEDRIARLRHASASMRGKAEWRRELRNCVHTQLSAVLSNNPTLDTIVDLGDQEEPLLYIADLVTSFRSTPQPGVATREIGTRLSQQLITLGKIRALADDRTVWSSDDTAFIRRIARDTLPSFLFLMIRVLHRLRRAKMENFSRVVHLSPAKLSAYLNQYKKLHIFTQDRSGYYALAPDVINQLNACRFFDD